MDVSQETCCQVAIPISDESCVGEARRVALRMAECSGFEELYRGHVGVIATELANNLHRYAQQGELLIQNFSPNGHAVIDFLAIDRGPGVVSVGRCLTDGYSTGGTLGTGLGAVRRLSTEFDMFSAQPTGTVVFARVSTGKSGWRFGAVCRPAPREVICGDSWWVAEDKTMVSALVADGLGHGPHAAEASVRAKSVFADAPMDSPDVIIARMHRALESTRGAAVLVVQIDLEQKRVKHAGIGNIGASVVTPVGFKGLVSLNGIVGVQTRRIQTFESVWSDNSLLVIYSDGLKSRWALEEKRLLTHHHPSTVAAVLARDFSRVNDDLTVLAIGSPND